MKESASMGHGGNCVCVKCGITIPHKAGVPCKQERCPQCNKIMLREGSPHHEKAKEKMK